MSGTAFRWRLAAVMAADVVGFSTLVEGNELDTVRRFKAIRERIVEPLIRQHNGRVFDVAGDCIMSLFDSAVHAAQCAALIQWSMAAAEAILAPERRLRLRIGITADEVLVDGAKAHGEAVILAARLQAAAEPGGICLSDRAHDHLRTRLLLKMEPAGTRQFKNLGRRVKTWRLCLDPPAAPEWLAKGAADGPGGRAAIASAASDDAPATGLALHRLPAASGPAAAQLGLP